MEIVHDFNVPHANSEFSVGKPMVYRCPHCEAVQTPQTKCLAERGYYVRTCLMQCGKCKRKYQYSA